MPDLGQLHFLRPWWLLATLPPFLLWWWVARGEDVERRWRGTISLGAPRLRAGWSQPAAGGASSVPTSLTKR